MQITHHFKLQPLNLQGSHSRIKMHKFSVFVFCPSIFKKKKPLKKVFVLLTFPDWLLAVNPWSCIWRGLGYTCVRVCCFCHRKAHQNCALQTLLHWLFCPVKRSCAEYSQYARLKCYSDRWSISWGQRWPLSSTLVPEWSSKPLSLTKFNTHTVEMIHVCVYQCSYTQACMFMKPRSGSQRHLLGFCSGSC